MIAVHWPACRRCERRKWKDCCEELLQQALSTANSVSYLGILGPDFMPRNESGSLDNWLQTPAHLFLIWHACRGRRHLCFVRSCQLFGGWTSDEVRSKGLDADMWKNMHTRASDNVDVSALNKVIRLLRARRDALQAGPAAAVPSTLVPAPAPPCEFGSCSASSSFYFAKFASSSGGSLGSSFRACCFHDRNLPSVVAEPPPPVALASGWQTVSSKGPRTLFLNTSGTLRYYDINVLAMIS